jgi:hypothetical protein
VKGVKDVDQSLFLLLPLLSLLVGVFVVRMVGEITGGVTFDSWGAVFGAVFVAYALWWVAGSTVTGFLPMSQNLLAVAVVALVFNIISLAFASAVISGMHVKGVFGLLLAAIALTAVDLTIAYLPQYAN